MKAALREEMNRYVGECRKLLELPRLHYFESQIFTDKPENAMYTVTANSPTVDTETCFRSRT